MDLHLNPDDLNACVQCGLCLPHCPTFRVSGEETMSPRGRIQLMREIQNKDAPVTADVVAAFETCVQCRGCEPACPSSVPYGHLMETTRETLAGQAKMTPRWERLALWPLGHPRALRVGTRLLAAAQRSRLVPKRLGLPNPLPVSLQPHQASGTDVYLFTGCVMDVWQRDVHLAGQRVLEAAGYGVEPTGDQTPCCGALHAHAGLTDTTRRFAESMIERLDDGRPVIVDSAGCGAAMKDYGRLIGSPRAEEFSARVFDISEWMALHMQELPDAPALDLRVAIQDPCHLRHVQRAHDATRTLLRPYVSELVELDDDGLCCGAGGAFSLMQPDLATDIRTRKLVAIARQRPDLVASANPGCAMHLQNAGVPIAHPIELVDRALSAVDGRPGSDESVRA